MGVCGDGGMWGYGDMENEAQAYMVQRIRQAESERGCRDKHRQAYKHISI
jgi:hypothetical protein